MENIYSWHAEVMVNLEMEEVRKEIESIRMLHDASLSNPGLFQRTVIMVGNILVKLGQRLCRKLTEPHQAYQITSSKFAT
jgi:hypothetical protein